MAYNISSFAGAGAQFFDSNGDPLSGGLLYVYTAGTTTSASSWTSNSGAALNTNPIVLDSAGRTPNEIWLNSGSNYKFVLKTSAGVLIGTYDNIPAIDDPTAVNNLITVTGTNTLLGTSIPPYTSYVTGMQISFVPVHTNTGAVTIDVDGLGAKNVYSDASNPLVGGELVLGKIAALQYDGTRFQLFSATGVADLSITTAKLAASAVTLVKIDPAVYAVNGASKLLQLDASGNLDSQVGIRQLQPITATVGSNALTITLNPTSLDFRDTPLTSGTVNTRKVAAAISLIVPSTATLGSISTVASRLAVLAIDNAGTVELAISNLSGGNNLDETTLISTNAVATTCTFTGAIAITTGILTLSATGTGTLALGMALTGTNVASGTVVQTLLSGSQGANGSTYQTNQFTAAASTAMTGVAGSKVYSTTARTSLPFRVVGFLDATEATAGTWVTAPSTIQGGGGQALTTMSNFGYNQSWKNLTGFRSVGVTYTNTTNKPILVMVMINANSGVSILVNGIDIANNTGSMANTVFFPLFVVPSLGTYNVQYNYGSTTPVWSEFR